MKSIDYSNSKYYENRELSWLKFNERVLSEAMDQDLPLFERLKFLSIVSSNLDEFIMVRVASLIDLDDAGINDLDIAGLSPKEQLIMIRDRVHELVDKQYDTYNNDIIPALLTNGLKLIEHYDELTEKQQKYADRYFENEVYPVLTPMAVDSSRPFPLVRNMTLNIGALIDKKNDGEDSLVFATVQVPSVLPRCVELPPAKDGERAVILLEEIIKRNLNKLFLNHDIVCAYTFRIMRNADLSLDEEDADDLLEEIEKQIKLRQWGKAIRMEVENGIDKRLLNILQSELALKDGSIFYIPGALDLTFLMKMYSMEGFDELKEHSYLPPQEVPGLGADSDVFAEISKGDLMLYHPYQSFEPVVNFVKFASADPKVLAIKQTLYRVSGNSPIIAALAKAAENGKQVTVLVELKARFDEENNILWARRLEQAGCHVIYGLVGLKTHSKITLVVRREEEGIKRYVHLGSGNYNDSTARLYSDIGLLTADEAIGEDATAVFNMLSGYSEPLNWNKLSLAPLWLKDRFLFLINREKENAKNGLGAHIIAKMNSICDADVIKALYEAAAAGVKIELIVRGICAIKTDVPGTKGNITVRSIIGNFLEHARIYYFENGGRSEYYCSSADWMPRNLERRVEILFPIEKEELRKKLKSILELQLADNEKAHILDDKGNYIRVKDIIKNAGESSTDKNRDSINSQLLFGKEAASAIKYRKDAEGGSRVFVPIVSQKGDHENA